ncbi:CDC40 [Cordylochernes scorpioides]|uniref:CDC40 n=1 Tax=Cordylochernes scorpioides TaxID=51811 RepID=A0ABY6JXM0_9ARAC|nr:CDC40 [Cordylochernes scorpioides]
MDNGPSKEEAHLMVGAIPENDKVPTVFEKTSQRNGDKRKRNKNDNPSDVEGFLGPWGKFTDEVRTAKPTPSYE